MGKIYVVGIGPGAQLHRTFAAEEAIRRSDVVVGYQTYLELVADLTNGKQVEASAMRQEEERCRLCADLASQGKTVALISSGDPGIYGMAGIMLSLCGENEVEVVPGVSAVSAAASVLGAPLMHDFAVISLSDLLTPWERIEKRLRCAAEGDFVIALYNPKSKSRTEQIEKAQTIVAGHRSGSTPVGIVRNACREGQKQTVTTLKDMCSCEIDMFSLVLIGNSQTKVENGKMITPRGYGI